MADGGVDSDSSLAAVVEDARIWLAHGRIRCSSRRILPQVARKRRCQCLKREAGVGGWMAMSLVGSGRRAVAMAVSAAAGGELRDRASGHRWMGGWHEGAGGRRWTGGPRGGHGQQHEGGAVGVSGEPALVRARHDLAVWR